nr:hypothetical protein GCM10020241_30230 [Streptoalloteichus tenebrarius]
MIIPVAVAGLGLAACTSTTPGLASTSTGSQSSAATSNGAPKVTSPKNLKAIADPCQLLTPQQLQEIGASNPTADKSLWGEGSCIWRNDNLRIRLDPDTTHGQGLTIVYNKNKDKPDYEQTTVNGHPAIRWGKEGPFCSVFVGVSDTQVLSADVAVLREVKPQYKDRCALVDKVAGMVLSNLPAAG